MPLGVAQKKIKTACDLMAHQYHLTQIRQTDAITVFRWWKHLPQMVASIRSDEEMNSQIIRFSPGSESLLDHLIKSGLY